MQHPPFKSVSFMFQLIIFSSHDAWVVSFPEEYVGTDVVKTASRLLPRSVFQSDDLRNQTWAAYKDAVDQVRRSILSNPRVDCANYIRFHFLTKYRVYSSPASTSAGLVSPSTPQQIPQCCLLGAMPSHMLLLAHSGTSPLLGMLLKSLRSL